MILPEPDYRAYRQTIVQLLAADTPAAPGSPEESARRACLRALESSCAYPQALRRLSALRRRYAGLACDTDGYAAFLCDRALQSLMRARAGALCQAFCDS